jgi:hypothetical protein
MLPSKNIYLQVKKTNSGGFKKPTVQTVPLPVKKSDVYNTNIDPYTGTISQDEMIILKEYAKALPSGNRQLKLNMTELKNTLLSNQLIKDPLTKTSGENRGGNTSLKLKTQGEYIQQTIKNKNKLKTNPNYTSFRNNISLV